MHLVVVVVVGGIDELASGDASQVEQGSED